MDAQKFVQHASIQSFIFVKPRIKNNKHCLHETHSSPFLFSLVLLSWLLFLASVVFNSGTCNFLCLFSCMWDAHAYVCVCVHTFPIETPTPENWGWKELLPILWQSFYLNSLGQILSPLLFVSEVHLLWICCLNWLLAWVYVTNHGNLLIWKHWLCR